MTLRISKMGAGSILMHRRQDEEEGAADFETSLTSAVSSGVADSVTRVIDKRRSAGGLPMTIAINGKFTSQRLTGVQRVAHELTYALTRRLNGHESATLFVPQNHLDDGTSSLISRRVVLLFRGVLWEQIALPYATSGRTLLSLCNAGPVFKRRQVLMIHDAAVFDLPEGYSTKFRLWYRFSFALLKRNVRHILTVSDFSKARIAARLDISPDHISVVRNGIDHLDRVVSDPSVLKRLELEQDGFVLIVGSLAPGKNLGRVLAAVALLARGRDCPRFVIAGGRNAGIFGSGFRDDDVSTDRIVWAGYVTDSELKALYEHAACFVFPSLYEGFGLPPLEAMYCGCPVIASREAAVPEVCGDAALYCDARSVEDIAAKIEYLMGDVEVRQEMRRKGREHAKRFSWNAAATELLRVLREIG